MPSDPYYPTIPTHLQNPDLQEGGTVSINRRPSMRALQGGYDPAEARRLQDEQFAQYEAQEAERLKDPDAIRTYADGSSWNPALERARPMAEEFRREDNMQRGRELQQHNPADDAAAREQQATQRRSEPSSIIRDAAQLPLTAASFVPGPIGIGAGALQGMEALYSSATEEFDPVNAAFGALSIAAPSVRALRGAKTGRMGSLPPPSGPRSRWVPTSETGYKVNPRPGRAAPASSIMDGEIMPDNVLPSGSTQSPLLSAGNQRALPPASTRLPESMGGIRRQTDPADVAEAVGRGFNPRAELQNRLRSPMSQVDDVTENVTQRGFDPLAELEGQGMTPDSLRGLKSSPGGANAAQRGNGFTPRSIDELADSVEVVDDLPIEQGEGSWDELDDVLSQHKSRMASVPVSRSRSSVRSMMPPERMSAMDALAAQDEVSNRSVLFGGAGANDYSTARGPQQKGKAVRPSQRTPIGR